MGKAIPYAEKLDDDLSRPGRVLHPKGTSCGARSTAKIGQIHDCDIQPQPMASVLENAFATQAAVRTRGEQDGQHVPGVKQEGAGPEQPGNSK